MCYQDVLWKSGFSRLYSEMPSRKLQAEGHKDACRVHGALTLNKVAGNFHVTAGKVTTITIFGSFPKFFWSLARNVSLASTKLSLQVLPIMGAHAHMTGFMETSDYNFSHR